MKKLLFLGFSVPILVNATGMAVSLSDLYLHNGTRQSQVVTIPNLPESINQFKLSPNSICRVRPTILFQPFTEESNSFVIMLENNANRDPIVIDEDGHLTLAHNAINNFSYSGVVQEYHLSGFCGSRLRQRDSLAVQPHTNNDSAPNFVLASCNKQSKFIYSLNQSNKYKFKKSIKFEKVKDCISIRQERIQNTGM